MSTIQCTVITFKTQADNTITDALNSLFLSVGTFSFSIESPLILLILLMVAALILAWVGYLRVARSLRRAAWLSLVAIRTLSIWMILLLICNLSLNRTTFRSEEPKLLFFLDQSVSMTRFEGVESRFATAVAALKEGIERSDGLPSTLTLFGEKSMEVDESRLDGLVPDGASTDIFQLMTAVQRAANNGPIAGIIVLSDGQFHQATLASDWLEALPAPVIALRTGKLDTRVDLQIREVQTNRMGRLDLSQIVTVKFTANPVSESTVSVAVEFEGGTKMEQAVRLARGPSDYSLSFSLLPHRAGSLRLTATASSLQGELNLENNTLSRRVEVSDAKREVLLFSGAVTPDLAFIRRSITSMPEVDLDARIELGAASPTATPAEIAEADLILMTEFPTEGTDRRLLQDVAAGVESGKTSLLLLVGKRTSLEGLRDLESVLPFTTTGLSSAPEETSSFGIPPGASFGNAQVEAFFSKENDLPPLTTRPGSFKLKTRGVPLLQSARSNSSETLMASFLEGNARSTMLTAWGIWRWGLVGDGVREARGEEATGVLRKILTHSIRSLGESQRPRFIAFPTKARYHVGEEIIFDAEYNRATSTPGDRVKIEIELPGLDRDPIRMQPRSSGRYRGRISRLDPGTYRYIARATEAKSREESVQGEFVVMNAHLEDTTRGAREDLLQLLAERSSGWYGEPKDVSRFLDSLQHRGWGEPVSLSEETETRARDSLPYLLFLLLLLCSEWILRRRSSLS